MKYIRKQIIVDVYEFNSDEIMPEWLKKCIEDNTFVINRKLNSSGEAFLIGKIQTSRGELYLEQGDFIIKSVEGEIYPCKAKIFHQLYEEYNDTNKVKNWGNIVKD